MNVSAFQEVVFPLNQNLLATRGPRSPSLVFHEVESSQVTPISSDFLFGVHSRIPVGSRRERREQHANAGEAFGNAGEAARACQRPDKGSPGTPDGNLKSRSERLPGAAALTGFEAALHSSYANNSERRVAPQVLEERASILLLFPLLGRTDGSQQSPAPVPAAHRERPA